MAMFRVLGVRERGYGKILFWAVEFHDFLREKRKAEILPFKSILFSFSGKGGWQWCHFGSFPYWHFLA